MNPLKASRVEATGRSPLTMSFGKAFPINVIARSSIERRSNLFVDQIASDFQESHHMQERRLLRPFGDPPQYVISMIKWTGHGSATKQSPH